MHKILSSLLILSLALGFASCSGDKDKDKEPDNKFVWNGNWNDPADPNYKPNGYNPLGGTYWQVDSDPTLVFSYTHDFQFIRYNYDPVTNVLVKVLPGGGSYIINDTGFKDTNYGYRAYKTNGNKLYEIQLGIGTVIKDGMWKSRTSCRPKNGQY